MIYKVQWKTGTGKIKIELEVIFMEGAERGIFNHLKGIDGSQTFLFLYLQVGVMTLYRAEIAINIWYRPFIVCCELD